MNPGVFVHPAKSKYYNARKDFFFSSELNTSRLHILLKCDMKKTKISVLVTRAESQCLIFFLQNANLVVRAVDTATWILCLVLNNKSC